MTPRAATRPDLGDYKDVPERINEFRAKYPDGRLRPADPANPYRIETIDGHTFIVYVAAAYRSPEDTVPAIGMAWEPFPGKTNFTRDSELQNAETSAWGRAIVAALASETKRVASAHDVELRQTDREAQQQGEPVKRQIADEWKRLGLSVDEGLEDYRTVTLGGNAQTAAVDDLTAYLTALRTRQPGVPPMTRTDRIAEEKAVAQLTQSDTRAVERVKPDAPVEDDWTTPPATPVTNRKTDEKWLRTFRTALGIADSETAVNALATEYQAAYMDGKVGDEVLDEITGLLKDRRDWIKAQQRAAS